MPNMRRPGPLAGGEPAAGFHGTPSTECGTCRNYRRLPKIELSGGIPLPAVEGAALTIP